MDKILDKYLSDVEKIEFIKIVNPIIEHEEFKRRMTKEFMHHSDITLSEHILEVACLTYKKGKKIKSKKFDLQLAVTIAMLHDLYAIPWQNNDKSKVSKFSNKHGFRHPIESVINSINWFPYLFEDDEKSYIIIDSIIHHMFPLGVRVFDNNILKLELKNENSFLNIDDKYKKMIIKSTSRLKVFKLSFGKPKYKEGKIVSMCDKKVSFLQIKNIHSLTALLTGKNKSI